MHSQPPRYLHPEELLALVLHTLFFLLSSLLARLRARLTVRATRNFTTPSSGVASSHRNAPVLNRLVNRRMGERHPGQAAPLPRRLVLQNLSHKKRGRPHSLVDLSLFPEELDAEFQPGSMEMPLRRAWRYILLGPPGRNASWHAENAKRRTSEAGSKAKGSPSSH